MMNIIVMMVVLVPVVTVVGVNPELLRRAQEGNDDNGGNGTAANTVRVQTHVRFSCLVGHVAPAAPGPYGWAQNPFAAAAEAAPPGPSLFSTPDPVVEPPQAASNPNTNAATSSDPAEIDDHVDALPLDFPTGNRTGDWGTSVQERHASWLWSLKYRGFSLHQWMLYFAQFSLWEWSTLCAETEPQGQFWTDVEWYEYFQQHYHSWSSLVWCLCFLAISPDTARRMISAQYFQKSRRDFSDDSHGSDGGSSSSCL